MSLGVRVALGALLGCWIGSAAGLGAALGKTAWDPEGAADALGCIIIGMATGAAAGAALAAETA